MNEKSIYAPIIVTVYDRLDHLQNCIESLKNNPLASQSDLFVLSDAPQKEEKKAQIDKVRQYIQSITGFKKVTYFFQETNRGAHQSIMEGVGKVLEEYDSFIFLEDDIVVSPNFLEYMNQGLVYYKEDKRIFSVCAFALPVSFPSEYKSDIYFYPCNSPWGFATWKERWEAVDFSYFNRYAELKKNRRMYRKFTSIGFFIKGILQADSQKKIVATDLRIYYHTCHHNMCSVFPVISKSQNRGFDGSGEHCDNAKAWWVQPLLDSGDKPTHFEPFTHYDKELLRRFRDFQDKINGGILAKHLKYTWIHRLYKKIRNR